jgi:transcriptional regulator with XRE-family HTH domain
VNYQLALTLFLQEQNTSLSELSLATGFSERWLRSICQDCSWIPRLDTLLILCEAIGIDILDFLAYAESGTERKEVTHTVQEISPTAITKTLRSFRLENNISQSRLSAITNFQVSSISFRESPRYQSYPAMDTLEIYCKAYKISIAEFLQRAANCQEEGKQACNI